MGTPQGPTSAQLRKIYAQELESERIAQIEKEQEERDEYERNAYTMLQEHIKDGNASAAVEVALDMNEFYEDGRQSCPVFQMVQWLKADGFFNAKIEAEWAISPVGRLIGKALPVGSFYIKEKDGHLGMALGKKQQFMVLLMPAYQMAFTGSDRILFTDTLKSIITARARYKEEFA